ncbi:hypothetical protein M0R45_013929 [Rubus argutus]|uniref:Cyclic nucleotide-binding domain-containing protein n=1 Tax=Rubus argutus TaxID=59490 RepID=A0AAW1XK90_RUBAR
MFESFVVSFPSSPGNVDGIEKQRPVPSRKTPVARLVASLVTLICLLICVASFATLALPFVLLLRLLDSLRRWKRVFILSCVAVSLDTLFLYIPIIDDKNKCLGMDKTLRNVALVFRSLTDFAFIIHIILLICGEMDHRPKWDDSNSDCDVSATASWFSTKLKPVREAIAERIPWLSTSIIINCLAILPIPQVTILADFYKMGGSKLFLKQTIINVFLLFQYLLRLFQMYLSGKELDERVGKWVKGSFYFFLYIIASHVLAAFWYFFSIQRVISCWHQTCRTIPGCVPNYDCGRNTSLNSTILNELCPINSPNTTLFDFGMYLDILQSGNTGSINFPTKFFYSFWWGLRNLSNFGTNLETSSYVWENCFAILICAIGLLLFLYLIGNVQTYIQSETEKLVKIEDSRRTRINEKRASVKEWISRHGLPDDMKTEIMNNINEQALVKFINVDVDIYVILNVQRGSYQKIIELICVEALKRVPMLQNMDGRQLKELSDLLTPLRFDPTKKIWIRSDVLMTKKRGSYIARAGVSNDAMYLIIDGVIERKNADETMSMITQTRSCYDYYGEELLRWAILNYNKNSSYYDPLPISHVDVTCQTKVQAFVFSSHDLIAILKRNRTRNISEKLEASARIPQDNTQNTVSTNSEELEESVRPRYHHQTLKEDELSRMVAWTCPERGWLKLNCSSIWNPDTKLADMGWVLRDDTGAFIAAGNVRGEPCRSISSADALTIRKAIAFCPKTAAFSDSMRKDFYELNSRFCFYSSLPKIPLKMVVESDNQDLIDDLIKGRSMVGSQYFPSDVRSIIRLKFIFEAITFVHCERQCNEAAHCVAKNAKDNAPDSVSDWHSTPPSWLTDALKLDRWLVYWRSGPEQNDKSEKLVDDGRDGVANTGASAPTSTNIEQTIRLHQGHDMILEQLILIRESMFQRLDDQGRRLDEMAIFLARLGYTGTSSPPPAS